MSTIKIEQPNILVVEGKDEELFFGALIKHLGLESFQILPIGGKDKLQQSLQALAKASGFHEVAFLGIVRDADADPEASFQSVKKALQNANLPAPEHPEVTVGEKPRVAVLILPEARERGTLEDLCLKAVEQDPAMSCVEQYFQCLDQIQRLDQKGLSPDNISKAKVQVFLASRHRAGLRLGEAAQAGHWPWDGGVFERIKGFLQQIGS